MFSDAFSLMDDITSRNLRVPAFLLSDVLFMAAQQGQRDAMLECVRRLTAFRQFQRVGGWGGVGWGEVCGMDMGECQRED
jgi:hypothetical protein